MRRSVKTDRQAYSRHKATARTRSAMITLAGQDIATLPPCAHPSERRRADGDFRLFCERYLPRVFN